MSYDLTKTHEVKSSNHTNGQVYKQLYSIKYTRDRNSIFHNSTEQKTGDNVVLSEKATAKPEKGAAQGDDIHTDNSCMYIEQTNKL